MRRRCVIAASCLSAVVALAPRAGAEPRAVPEAGAREPYVETLPGTTVSFDMAPVPGGAFEMGSAEGEPGRRPDEGPVHRVEVGGFWMGRREVTWAEYDLFRADPEAIVRAAWEPPPGADALTRPTPAYADETFGFGKEGQPVISITHAAAVEYTRWLSRKAGRPYRLPTEAEWEWACRSAGGEGPLGDRAWFAANAESRPHPVATRAPDRLGLFDLLGNVAEWVLDRYEKDAYASRSSAAVTKNPIVAPDDREYPHVARGGSWKDAGSGLRCAARLSSSRAWNERDPQDPQSIWWLTDGTFVAFRVVSPFEP